MVKTAGTLRRSLFRTLCPLFLCLLGVIACQKSPEEARRELRAMNIEFTPDAFFARVSDGDIRAVELFLGGGMDPNVEGRFKLIFEANDRTSMTGPAVILAAWKGHTTIVEMLLEHGADPNGLAAGPYVVDALMAAAHSHHLNEGDRVVLVKTLAKKGARLHWEIPIFLKESEAKQAGEAYYILQQVQKDYGVVPIPWEHLGEKGKQAREQEERNQAAANEASAIASVRNLITAEVTYSSTKGSGQYGSLADLKAGGLIDEALASGIKDGYLFAVDGAGSSDDFQIVATPKIFGRTGERSFFGDSTGVIRYSRDGSRATKYERPLGQ